MPTINSQGSRSAGAQEGSATTREAWGGSGRWPQQELEERPLRRTKRPPREGGRGWPEGERVVLRGDRGRPGPSPPFFSFFLLLLLLLLNYPAPVKLLLILLIIPLQAHTMLLVL